MCEHVDAHRGASGEEFKSHNTPRFCSFRVTFLVCPCFLPYVRVYHDMGGNLRRLGLTHMQQSSAFSEKVLERTEMVENNGKRRSNISATRHDGPLHSNVLYVSPINCS